MRHVASAPANLAMMAHSYRNKPSISSKIVMYIPNKYETYEINEPTKKNVKKKLGKDDTFYELVSCIMDDGCVIDDSETKTILTHVINSIYEATNEDNIKNKTTDILFFIAQRFIVSYVAHHVLKDVFTVFHSISM